jgi:hypothetical protein
MISNSRFSSPSQLSMEIAAAFLEDQQYVSRFLQKSHRSLLQSRLLAEDYLAQAGIQYHHPGSVYPNFITELHPTYELSLSATHLLTTTQKRRTLHLDRFITLPTPYRNQRRWLGRRKIACQTIYPSWCSYGCRRRLSCSPSGKIPSYVHY